ncbi:MAG: SBBP repeat-containing protein [Nitrosopumilus sp.]|nr:SBBP repeat-containing protein [Nitrosopumilus sp.]
MKLQNTFKSILLIIFSTVLFFNIILFEDVDAITLSTFGSEGSGNGEFDSQNGITVDSNDRIIVADTNNHRIQIFDSAGNFVSTFGRAGYGDDVLGKVRGVAVDSNDRIIVAEPNLNHITILTDLDYESDPGYQLRSDSFTELATTNDGNIQYTTSLHIPNFTVDASRFADTDEIILDVEFNNARSNDYSGFSWNIYDSNSENPSSNAQELLFYERLRDSRSFTIIVKEIVDSSSRPSDVGKVTVHSDDEFINLIGQPYNSAFEIGIVDIDDVVKCTTDQTPSIKMKLKVSSPTFSPGSTYQIRILTSSPGLDHYQIVTIPLEAIQLENKDDSTSIPIDPNQLTTSKSCIDDDIKRQTSFVEKLDDVKQSSSKSTINSEPKDESIQWSVQFGNDSIDGGGGIAIDSLDNTYVTGYTDGNLFATNAGFADGFIVKYDINGNELWTKQFGGTFNDLASDITVDSLDNVYVAGSTNGDLFETSAGNNDAFIVKYDTNGNELWTKQFGSSMLDVGGNLVVDSLDNVYFTGNTRGDLFGTNEGGFDDIFLLKYKSQIITSMSTVYSQLTAVVESESICGAGTELINGICKVLDTYEEPSEETSFFENIFRFFKSLFD